MRAVIAVPSVTDFYFTPHRASALGARMVEKVLQQLGWNTVLLDFLLSTRRGSPLPLPPELSHLKPFILPGETGPTAFFRRYKRFGPPPAEAAAAVLSRQPELVLVSCFAWAYSEEARDLIHAIKAGDPSLPVILGGPGASVLPEYFTDADYVLRGEAEVQLPELLSSFSVPRVMPFDPARAAEHFTVPWALTRRGRIRQINLHLSRGCSLRCRFCSNHLTAGRRFRKAPLEKLAASLAEVEAVFGPGSGIIFNIEDDNLLLDPDFFMAALDMIRRRFPQAIFRSENGLDYRLMPPEVMEALIDAGYDQFNISIARDGQTRSVDQDRYEALLSLAASRNIRTISYFIAGLPGDSTDNLIHQLTYLARLPTDIGISLFYPVPGLPGFEDPAPFLKVPPKLCAGSSAYPWGQSLTMAEMVTAFRLSRMINFLKRPAESPREDEQREELLKTRRLLTWRKGDSRGHSPPGTDEGLAASVWEAISPAGGVFGMPYPGGR